MPPESAQTAESGDTNNYYSMLKKELDNIILDLHQEGYRKAEISPPSLAAKADLNYNTAHKNGAFHQLQAKIPSLDYRKWNGYKISIPDYVENQELLETSADDEQ